MSLRLTINVTELKLYHEFKKSFIHFWTNQSRYMYKVDEKQKIIKLQQMIDPKSPCGLVGGVFGIKDSDTTHTVGFCLIDLSKISKNKNNLTVKIFDPSLSKSVTGTMSILINNHSNIQFPSIECLSDKNINTVHEASENNLHWIAPYSEHGYQPIDNNLNKIHSPYYTSNIGVTMPSGTFLMTKTSVKNEKDYKKSLTSMYTRFITALKNSNSSPSMFTNDVKRLNVHNFRKVVLPMARTFLMHAVHCIQYTSDIQYTFLNRRSGTGDDRWETPRENNSYAGDCEDCAKEIYIEIMDWKNIKSEKPEIKALQELISYYVPVVIQGAVRYGKYIPDSVLNNITGFKNHIWAAMIPKHTFYANSKNWKTNIPEEKRQHTFLPTIMLEGTGPVYPLYVGSKELKRHNKLKKTVEKSNPLWRRCITFDKNPENFYHVVINMMSSEWEKEGILDFTVLTKNKYGVLFEDWWKGKYHLKPNVKYTQDTMKLFKQILSFDKPIEPLLYLTSKKYNSNRTLAGLITFHYKVTHDDTFHKKMIKAAASLPEPFYAEFNVDDHEWMKWVRWEIYTKHKKTDKLPGIIMMDSDII